jgi:hypothetical protein
VSLWLEPYFYSLWKYPNAHPLHHMTPTLKNQDAARRSILLIQMGIFALKNT